VLVALFGLAIYANRGLQNSGPKTKNAASRAENPKLTVAKTGVAAKPAAPQQSGGSFDIASSVIANGGGDSTGGSLSLTGVIGQPVVDTSSGGAFTLTSGFLQAALPDLTATKTNNVGGNAFVGSSFTWTIHIVNNGSASADFADGQIMFVDNLQTGTVFYTGGLVANQNGVTGLIACGRDAGDLSCSASGAVSIASGGFFDVQTGRFPE